jgi:hypothetical protein
MRKRSFASLVDLRLGKQHHACHGASGIPRNDVDSDQLAYRRTRAPDRNCAQRLARALAHRLLLGRSMRNTSQLPSLEAVQLANVTGGCHKKCAPCAPPPPPQQAPADDGGVSVEVATGAAAMQAISGGAPQIQR